MVWWAKPQTFCLGFESLQRHKKDAFLRECTVVGCTVAYCSGSTVARWLAEKSPIFFIFGPFFQLYWRFIVWCRYIGDFCWFSAIFLLSDFSLENIVLMSPNTQYIADISRHFPPWLQQHTQIWKIPLRCSNYEIEQEVTQYFNNFWQNYGRS